MPNILSSAPVDAANKSAQYDDGEEASAAGGK
jgi:hypothetical protein